MKTLNVHAAKTNLSTVLACIERTGESFLICRKGKPIADLVPHRRVDRLKTDPFLSKITVKTDLTKPLSEGEWENA